VSPRGSVAIDLVGTTFGRLTVVARAGTTTKPSGGGDPTWACRCECGTEKVIRGKNLRSGQVRSCGCLAREVSSSRLASRRGEKHFQWKGDAIGYDGAHQRVDSAKGKAADHQCVDCGDQADDWSYVGGCPRERVSDEPKTIGCVYSPDPNYYVPRCKKCHWHHDRGDGRRDE